MATALLQASVAGETRRYDVERATGLEKRWRFQIAEAARKPAAERWAALEKAELAREKWLAALEFSGLPAPQTTSLDVGKDGDVKEQPDTVGFSPGDEAEPIWRKLPPPSRFHIEPHYGLSLRQRHAADAVEPGEANAAMADLVYTSSPGETPKPARGSFHFVATQRNTSEPALNLTTSPVIVLTPPPEFADLDWRLWQREAGGAWRSTLRSGHGTQPLRVLRFITARVDYALLPRGEQPGPDMKPMSSVLLDARPPRVVRFAVAEEKGWWKIVWEVEDENLAETPVAIDGYGQGGLVLFSLDPLPARGSHPLHPELEAKDLRALLLRAKDRAGRTVTASWTLGKS